MARSWRWHSSPATLRIPAQARAEGVPSCARVSLLVNETDWQREAPTPRLRSVHLWPPWPETAGQACFDGFRSTATWCLCGDRVSDCRQGVPHPHKSDMNSLPLAQHVMFMARGNHGARCSWHAAIIAHPEPREAMAQAPPQGTHPSGR